MKKRSKMKPYVLWLLAACLTPLTGCSTLPMQFSPRPVDAESPVSCHSFLNPSELYVSWEKRVFVRNHYYGGGLIGAVVNKVADDARERENNRQNELRRNNAEVMGAPLAGLDSGTSLENDFDAKLSDALGSSSWLKSASLNANGSLVGRGGHEPVVMVNLQSCLSWDASVLILCADLKYYRQGQTVPSYSRKYTYYSSPIGTERNEEAVKQWVSNRKILRDDMNEGVKEIISMMNMDFLNPVKFGPEPEATVSCFNAGICQNVKWTGHIRGEGSNRIVFQSVSGEYFSLVPYEIKK